MASNKQKCQALAVVSILGLLVIVCALSYSSYLGHERMAPTTQQVPYPSRTNFPMQGSVKVDRVHALGTQMGAARIASLGSKSLETDTVASLGSRLLETDRVASHGSRLSAKTARVAPLGSRLAETGRVASHGSRLSAETARVAPLGSRLSETGRVAYLGSRSSETARVASLGLRSAVTPKVAPLGSISAAETARFTPLASESLETGGVALHPDVKVVSSVLPQGVRLPYEDCVPLPGAPSAGVRICLHPISQDKYVSGSIKQGGLWESNLIHEMASLLRENPNLQVLDIGCNIGEYTLWAAALGCRVLAVEMLESNVHMVQRALQMSNLGSKVTMVNNAVYNDHRKLQTLFLKGNMGGTRLNTSSNDDPSAMVDEGKVSVTVNTVCLDDLLPLIPPSQPIFMKIDVENSEAEALDGAHKLFQQREVLYVQMEWLARRHSEIRSITGFMARYGYVPSKSLIHPSPVNVNVSTISGHDVYFIKKERVDFGRRRLVRV